MAPAGCRCVITSVFRADTAAGSRLSRSKLRSTRHQPSSREVDNGLAYSCRNGAKVRDQVSGEVPPGFARPWDSLRWLREPLAWTLLALAALIVLVSACQLFHLAGATIPVAQPVAVRYAWADNPEGCNLYNKDDLPASPFRTDDWPLH